MNIFLIGKVAMQNVKEWLNKQTVFAALQVSFLLGVTACYLIMLVLALDL